MYLIQFLLPLKDNQDNPFAPAMFDQVLRELTERFGGVTAFLQSPARGLWRPDAARPGWPDVQADRLALFEVMSDALDRPFWALYRRELEQRFRQQAIVVRAMPSEVL